MSGDRGIEELIASVNAASEGAVNVDEVKRRLGGRAEDEGTPLGFIDAAFMYRERRGGSGYEYFDSLFQIGDEAIPPVPVEMPAEVQDVWAAVAAGSIHPIVRARLHDLCFVARHGEGRDHAHEAVGAYLKLADRYPADSAEETFRINVALGATKYISRALDLARRTRQDELAGSVLETGIRLARISLADPASGPGVVLGLLRPLSSDPECPSEVDDLLDAARDQYQYDVWNTMSTIEVQLGRHGLDNAGRESLHRQQVNALMSAADNEQPVIALMHLQEAIQLAEKQNLADLKATAIRKLQDLSKTDLGLTSRVTTSKLGGDQVDRWLEQFIDSPTWQEAIMTLLGAGAPTGRVEMNQAMAARMPEIAPLATSLPTMHIGPGGLPSHTSSGDDPSHLLATVEMHNLQMYGPLTILALRAIGEKWGPVDVSEAAEFFSRAAHVPEDVGRSLARALNRHFAQDFEGSAFTALPKIERIARELSMTLGIVVYRPPAPPRPGVFVGLGDLVGALEDYGLDPSWARFLLMVFARQEGMNLRNEVLHGSIVDLGEDSSALVLIASLYLALALGAAPAEEPS